MSPSPLLAGQYRCLLLLAFGICNVKPTSIRTILQVESTLAMQNLQPKLKAIQQRYAGDQVPFDVWLVFVGERTGGGLSLVLAFTHVVVCTVVVRRRTCATHMQTETKVTCFDDWSMVESHGSGIWN